jgi:hypothetical protein
VGGWCHWAGLDAARISKLHDQIVPSGIRTIFELNKGFERMADPFGFGRFGINSTVERAGMASFSSLRLSELTTATKLHHEFAGVSRLIDEARAKVVLRDG